MAKSGILAKSHDLKESFTATTGEITIGIDLEDRFSHCCVLGADGTVLTEGRVVSTPDGMARHFQQLPPTRIAFEVGSHSRWVSELLTSWGHEVILANPRNLRMISDSIRKSDRVDAHTLARLARIDPQLLSPIVHSNPETYSHMTLLKSRDLLVRTRTRLTNATRGVMKAVGLRLPSAGGTSFPSKTTLLVPEELKPSLLPLLETISHLNKQIYQFDKAIERAAREKYPETGRLRQISGVGPVTSLQYVLTIGDPNRFAHSRDVGPYLGLTPRRRQSGDIDQQLRISKAGNRRLRSLLVQCAQYLLGRFGPDTDLKRWGARMTERGGKNAKKRAIVAVARKLAVLCIGFGSRATPTDPCTTQWDGLLDQRFHKPADAIRRF
jgi:transposase